MLNTREIMELQKLAGMNRFRKRTVAEELERQKLIELLSDAPFGVKKNPLKSYLLPESMEAIADHLIANGTTIPVRCKQCRSWERNIESSPEHGTCYCHGFNRGIVKHENGYCDKGVRRENNG